MIVTHLHSMVQGQIQKCFQNTTTSFDVCPEGTTIIVQTEFIFKKGMIY